VHVTTADQPLLRSPLHERHVALGAKFAPFGGWEMPLEYAGGGVIAEHNATREAVGLFDVSHLGTAVVTGPDAVNELNAVLANDLRRIRAGQAQYTLLLNDVGGVVDDLIAYYVSNDEVLLIPNAANSPEVLRTISAALPAGIAVEDQHRNIAILAVQGPKSEAVMAAVGLPADLPYMAFEVRPWEDILVTVCRTGYTGEHGYEVLVGRDHALDLWDALAAAVADVGGRPAGLAARDTLRTEMGYPLHGQDLSPTINPVEAGASWAVGWDKEAFHGRAAVREVRENGPTRRLRGLRLLDRGVPRAHMVVHSPDAEGGLTGPVVGEVTSGTHSPTLREGIALALVDSSVELGAELVLDVRGRPLRVAVTQLPFVESHVK
jgi:aminomethyltransferase